ncbi:hypothetical protein FRC08_006040, partial [Ceratobasidium sp. 394]
MARSLLIIMLFAFVTNLALGVRMELRYRPPHEIQCQYDGEWIAFDASDIGAAIRTGLTFREDPDPRNPYPKVWDTTHGPDVERLCGKNKYYEYPIVDPELGWPGPFRVLFSVYGVYRRDDDEIVYIVDFCAM